MVDPVLSRVWAFRAFYVVLLSVFVFLRLLPMGDFANPMPGPDLILAVTLAWVMRRPDYVPAVLIVAVFLLTDLLFHHAPGLWAALVLAGTEFLRHRQAHAREIPFALEWSMVAGVLAAMVAMNHLVLSLFFVERPALGLFALEALYTALVYPIVVALGAVLLNVRRATPEELALRGAPS